jgi:polysaccharide export outer membrane protein
MPLLRAALVLLALAALAPAPAARGQDGASAGAQADSGVISLQPGDLVRVSIYREPDLSGEFLVDEDGVVTFPLIGEQRVSGVPMRRLREMLMEAYRVHIRNPSIVITPLRRINVLGEVQRPGLYPVDPTVSLAGAVALAGGATNQGDLRKIRIVREGRVYTARVGAGELLSSLGVRSGDEIYVGRRSWVERNSALLLSLATSFTTTIIVIATRK